MNLKFLILKKKIECGRMFLFIRCLYNAYRMDISRNCVNQIKYKQTNIEKIINAKLI